MRFSPYLHAMVCGVAATVTMDTLNYLVSSSGLIGKMDPSITGRLADGWLSGRFVYENFAQVPQVQYAFAKGIFAHYLIGVIFAGCFLHLAHRWAMRGFGHTTAFGLATSVFSLLVLFPSVGLGPFAMNEPHGPMLVRSSLINHLFYGIGLFIGLRLLRAINFGQAATQRAGSSANGD